MTTKVETNEEYHANKRYLSSSAVKTIASMSVYHLLHSTPYKGSEDMFLGTAVHARFLEPNEYLKNYLVMAPFNGATRVGKEMKADYEATGKLLLKYDHGQIIEGLAKSLEDNDLAKSYLVGEAELSHYSEYMGIKVKVRPDVKNPEFLSDIKTCQNASPKAFRRDVYKYLWHVQAAFYCEVLGYSMDQFKFIAMQKSYPFDVVPYTLSEQMQEEGYELMVEAVSKWKRYLETGHVERFDSWPKANDGTLIL